MKRLALAGFAALTTSWLGAQSLLGEPEFILAERQELTVQRESVMAVFQQEAKACWQKFAVNACLSEARSKRRIALELLRQQDMILNEQERQWRTEQRNLRLQGKQPENRSTP